MYEKRVNTAKQSVIASLFAQQVSFQGCVSIRSVVVSISDFLCVAVDLDWLHTLWWFSLVLHPIIRCPLWVPLTGNGVSSMCSSQAAAERAWSDKLGAINEKSWTHEHTKCSNTPNDWCA